MEKFKLNNDLTIADFRYAFSQRYEFLYFRVAKNKFNNKKLLHSFDGYKSGAIISFDGSQLLEQFEATTKALTGADVELYIEVKKNIKSTYFLCSKEYPGKTLNELEAIAIEMGAVSQKEYMKKLTSNSDINIISSVSIEQIIENTSYFYLIDENMASENSKKEAIFNIILTELFAFKEKTEQLKDEDISIAEKVSDIEIILRYSINLFPLKNFTIDGKFLSNDSNQDENTLMDFMINMVDENIWEPYSDSAYSFNDINALINLFFPTGLTFFESKDKVNSLYSKLPETLDESVSTSSLISLMWNEEHYVLSEEYPDAAELLEQIISERDAYEVLDFCQDSHKCISRSCYERIIEKFEETASDEQKNKMAAFIEELKANWD